jgi:hypothetical protein
VSDPAEQRLADQLYSAFREFMLAARKGSVTHAQRTALATALTMAEALPHDLYSNTIDCARIDAGKD